MSSHAESGPGQRGPSQPAHERPWSPRPGQPFLRRGAQQAGISDDHLAGPGFRAIFRGVHVTADVPITLTLRAQAALTAAPAGAMISHHTAAKLWGGVVPDTSAVHVSIPPGTSFSRAGVIVHRPHTLPAVGTRRRVRVARPEETFLACAAYLALVELVVLGESLVGAGATTAEALITAAAHRRGRGTRLARSAAALVRRGVDSPPETRLRLLLCLAGLPEPEVDHRIYSEVGQLLYRFDLSYPQIKLAIEYDGRHHERDPYRGRDLLRREDLEADGWAFVVVVTEHLNGTPGDVLARVARVMQRRGMPVPRLSERWRQHFSQRERPA